MSATPRLIDFPKRTRGAAAVLVCVIAVGIAISAPLSAPLAAQHSGTNASRPTNTIPRVAKTAGQFMTLLAAVEAAGLTETLMGRGPLTLFAPTDDAFKRLPGGTVEELLKPQNREKLVTILTYHVVAGRVTADQARGLRSAETVAKETVRLSESDGQLRVNDATVRIADIPASNGLIHVIDPVLLPPDRSAATVPASGERAKAVSLVDYAIDRGAPLYNDGQPAATVAVYETAINALLLLNADGLSADDRRALNAALRDGRGASTKDRAFALRRALDDARRQINGQMELSRR